MKKFPVGTTVYAVYREIDCTQYVEHDDGIVEFLPGTPTGEFSIRKFISAGTKENGDVLRMEPRSRMHRFWVMKMKMRPPFANLVYLDNRYCFHSLEAAEFAAKAEGLVSRRYDYIWEY